MVVVVAGDGFAEAEEDPGEHGADDGAVDEVDGEGGAAEPEEGWMGEAALEEGREHDAHREELDADTGPITELLGASREDPKSELAQVFGPLGPVIFGFRVAA